MSNDRDYAEKRFRDPAAFRAAARYTALVVVIAAVAFAAYAIGGHTSVFGAALVPAFLFLGGVGAVVRTYREWRAGRGWAAWQGAAWFLLLLMLLCLGLPAGAAFSK
jgi:hypothetical protein